MACSIYDKYIKVTTYKCSIKCYFILCCDFGTKNGPGCTQWNYPNSGWVTLKLVDKACFTYIFPGHIQAWALT